MRKKRNIRHAPLMSPQMDGHSAGHVLASLPPCPVCGLKDQQLAMLQASLNIQTEQVSFLRNQVMKLQDQMLSFVPNAADQYTRMTLSRQAAMNPEAINGIASMSSVIPDDMEMSELDELHSGIMKQYSTV